MNRGLFLIVRGLVACDAVIHSAAMVSTAERFHTNWVQTFLVYTLFLDSLFKLEHGFGVKVGYWWHWPHIIWLFSTKWSMILIKFDFWTLSMYKNNQQLDILDSVSNFTCSVKHIMYMYFISMMSLSHTVREEHVYHADGKSHNTVPLFEFDTSFEQVP